MALPPKVPLIASIVAFLTFVFGVLAALTGPVAMLPFALIPLAAGIGIIRRRVWSAYGYALLLLAQIVVSPFVVMRSRALTSIDLSSLGMLIVEAGLFLLAGRALAKGGGVRGWAAPWVVLAFLSTAPMLFIQAFVIPSASMENTLLIGDRVLTRRFPAPAIGFGDIVAVRSPTNYNESMMKRIIGMPGDRIKMVNKTVYRNGSALTEPYAIHKSSHMDPYRDNFPEGTAPAAMGAQDMLAHHLANGEIVVPAGQYFLLGDNRDDSWDSRYWGFSGRADILGKPFVIYDSEQPPADTGEHPTRWSRIFKLL